MSRPPGRSFGLRAAGRKPRAGAFHVIALEARQLLAGGVAAAAPVPAEVQSFDGTGNNLASPAWGAAGTALLRVGPYAYADGVAAPGGTDRPNARAISNALADHPDAAMPDARGLTAMAYVWGQFLDHDIDLTPTSAAAGRVDIPVPLGDPAFDPAGSGTAVIPVTRSLFDAASGTSAANPLRPLNVISAFVDGSQVHGSDAARAAALRTFSGGMLKLDAAGLLPTNAAGLANANEAHVAADADLFLAGDVRANENIELTALHTLFVREHNRLAAGLGAADPTLTDEQVYQQARRVVIAELQAITYNEFLPALLGRGAIGPYRGYDPTVNPAIAAEFSAAAFRLGHSMVGDDVEFLGDDGEEVRDALPFSQAFFNPAFVRETGIDPILKYSATDPSQAIDTKVVDSLRNMLFGPPVAGGLDLAAINIQRGRELGLGDYNTVRRAYGLPAVASFAGITADPALQAALRQTYGDVSRVDLWVGGLAEDHAPGSSVGPTFRRILADQFERLRAGDRFWYENTSRGAQLDELRKTTLAAVIERNTGLTSLQANAFLDPSLFTYDVPEGRAGGPVTVRITADAVRVEDARTGRVLARSDLAGLSRIVVTGSDLADDTITLDLGGARSLPAGGITVDGGLDPRDRLVVLGTPGADRIAVTGDTVTVNGRAARFAGFASLAVRAGAGDDTITVAPAMRSRVAVDAGPGRNTVDGRVVPASMPRRDGPFAAMGATVEEIVPGGPRAGARRRR
jgi:hypothetical protein